MAVPLALCAGGVRCCAVRRASPSGRSRAAVAQAESVGAGWGGGVGCGGVRRGSRRGGSRAAVAQAESVGGGGPAVRLTVARDTARASGKRSAGASASGRPRRGLRGACELALRSAADRL